LALTVITTPTEVSLPFFRLGVFHPIHVGIAAAWAAGTIAQTLLFQELNGGLFISTDQWNFLDNWVILGGTVLYFALVHG